MTRPSPLELFAEAARLAQAFHWTLDDILDLEHPDRRRFIAAAQALTDEQLAQQRALYDEYVNQEPAGAPVEQALFDEYAAYTEY
jgi:hypothetical protein